MNSGHQEFHDLMERVRAGDPEAAEELLSCYHDDLYRVIRLRLHKRLRTQFDSVDFVQSVWGEFFAIPADKLRFNDASTLRSFLLDMAATKVIDTFRSRMQTACRNLKREHSLDGSAAMAALGLTADDASPSQAASDRELWEQLLKGLPETSQTILSLLREGRSQREIAQTVRVSERTIHRLLGKLQSRPSP